MIKINGQIHTDGSTLPAAVSKNHYNDPAISAGTI